MSKPHLFTKDFSLVSLVNFSVVLNFYLLIVAMPVFAMESLRSSPSEAGFTSSIFVIGILLGRLWSGRWIERIGRKKTLYIGLILSLVSMLLYFQVHNILLLYLLRFINGAAVGISSTTTGTIVAKVIPNERRGEGIGYYALSGTFGAASGPFLAMVLLRYENFNIIFLVTTISVVLSLLMAFFLAVPEIKLTQEELQDLKEFKFASFFETKAIPISIVCAVAYSCYASILTFLPAYAKEIQVVEAASFFFIVYSATILLSRPVTGRLFDTRGENFVMYPAMFIYMLGIIIISQAHIGYTLLLAGALIGLGLGTVQSSCQTIAVKVTPPHRMGLANSTFFLFLDAGIGIGPFMFGLIMPFIGYRGVYSGAALIVLISAFLYYQLHGKKVLQGQRELG